MYHDFSYESKCKMSSLKNKLIVVVLYTDVTLYLDLFVLKPVDNKV